jgi:aminopeptidase N
VAQPEGVTVHEAGHQFWYGIVANNEFEHAWMDEGLNTFSTGATIEQAFTPNYHAERFFGGFIPWVYRDIPLARDRRRTAGPATARGAQRRAGHPVVALLAGAGEPMSYSKTALWLHTLERHLGWPTLQRILSTFFERWKFGHRARRTSSRSPTR